MNNLYTYEQLLTKLSIITQFTQVKPICIAFIKFIYTKQILNLHPSILQFHSGVVMMYGFLWENLRENQLVCVVCPMYSYCDRLNLNFNISDTLFNVFIQGAALPKMTCIFLRKAEEPEQLLFHARWKNLG